MDPGLAARRPGLYSVTPLGLGQPFLERYIVNMSCVSDDAPFTLEFSAENDVGYETEYELCWTALEGDVDGDGNSDSPDEAALTVASNPVDDSDFRADLDHDNHIEGGSSKDDWQVFSDNENDTAGLARDTVGAAGTGGPSIATAKGGARRSKHTHRSMSADYADGAD